MRTVPILDSCLPFLQAYPAIICDIWGVLHDGVTAYEDSNVTLPRYRAAGGKVVLLSNSPQLSWQIKRHLTDIGVKPDAYDSIVTSGDITIRVVNALGLKKIFHIGPGRHDPLYDNQPYSRVALEDADGIICTGFYDDNHDDMSPYPPLMHAALQRQLPFVCANPDLVVDVGGTLFPCAGLLAQQYEQAGGTVHWAGKPHQLAFDMARDALNKIKTDYKKNKILMIGDTLRTDIAGGAAAGLDTLFLAQGIHKKEAAANGRIDPEAMAALFKESGLWPTAAAYDLA